MTLKLSRRFGKRLAIANLNLQVQEGDIYGFLGPNGAGKTTAIRCILGLLRIHEGDVRIFGESHPVLRRQGVGAMVETPSFHGDMSAWDNLERSLAYAGRGSRADVATALERVGLKGREREKVKTYSLGMRQRLGIARALVGQPRLLILDEPTNGLDPRGMKEVRDLVKELAAQGLTIFLSSHLLAEVEQMCTRVGILDKGRLIAEGTLAELGGRGKVLEIGADDMRALRAALERIPGVKVVEEGERLLVTPGGLSAAALNRVLLEAGVEVNALVPAGDSLERLFLSLTSEEIT